MCELTERINKIGSCWNISLIIKVLKPPHAMGIQILREISPLVLGSNPVLDIFMDFA